jgi:hypothetical protein
MQEALAAWKRYVYFVSFCNKIFLVVSKTEVLLAGTMSTSLNFFENPHEEMYLPFVCHTILKIEKATVTAKKRPVISNSSKTWKIERHKLFSEWEETRNINVWVECHRITCCNGLGILYSRWNFIALQKSMHYS